MTELIDIVVRLELEQYYHVLRENGFETWDTVLCISEDDLQNLGFKLGHRRKLQREIATFHGFPSSLPLETEPYARSSSTLANISISAQPVAKTAGDGKRRHLRHPQPDGKAPKKPKTAYVNFSERLRTDPAISSLSFVEIAKEVGRQWRDLAPDMKRKWESEAALATQKYETQMDEYKKTDRYRRYQAYRKDFRARQARSRSGSGRGVRTQIGTHLAHQRGSLLSASSSPISLPSSQIGDIEVDPSALALALHEVEFSKEERLAAGA